MILVFCFEVKHSECRLACGGHGFSFQSGLTSLRDFCDPFCTFEGDNFVLLQQLERFLLLKLQKQNFDSPMQSLDILRNFDAMSKSSGFSSLDQVGAALDFKAGYLLREGGSVLAEHLAKHGTGMVVVCFVLCCVFV